MKLQTMKILKIQFEYWLLGTTTGASVARNETRTFKLYIKVFRLLKISYFNSTNGILMVLFWCTVTSKKITQRGLLLESNKPVSFTVLSIKVRLVRAHLNDVYKVR